DPARDRAPVAFRRGLGVVGGAEAFAPAFLFLESGLVGVVLGLGDEAVGLAVERGGGFGRGLGQGARADEYGAGQRQENDLDDSHVTAFSKRGTVQVR